MGGMKQKRGSTSSINYYCEVQLKPLSASIIRTLNLALQEAPLLAFSDITIARRLLRFRSVYRSWAYLIALSGIKLRECDKAIPPFCLAGEEAEGGWVRDDQRGGAWLLPTPTLLLYSYPIFLRLILSGQ